METTHPVTDGESPPGAARAPRFLRALRTRETSGQAIVEFALVSVAFFSMIFGTVDFGRVIYQYSQLQNSVREGARFGKMYPTNNFGIEEIVLTKGDGLDIMPDDIVVSCTGGCYPGCADVTVSATALFTPITASFLGLGPEDLPIRLRASATVTSE